MAILQELNAVPVQRNSGIDGFLREYIDNRPVSVKIQKADETLEEAINRQIKSSKIKQCSFMILVRTHMDILPLLDFAAVPDNMRIIDSYEVAIDSLLEDFKHLSDGRKTVAM